MTRPPTADRRAPCNPPPGPPAWVYPLILLLWALPSLLISGDQSLVAHWVNDSRLGTPDIAFVALVLGGITCLLHGDPAVRTTRLRPIAPTPGSDPPPALTHTPHWVTWAWRLLGGVCLGLAVLMRSVMAVLPVLALIRYLLGLRARGGRGALRPILLGFGLGLLPPLVWLALTWGRLDLRVPYRLVAFAVELGLDGRWRGAAARSWAG